MDRLAINAEVVLQPTELSRGKPVTRGRLLPRALAPLIGFAARAGWGWPVGPSHVMMGVAYSFARRELEWTGAHAASSSPCAELAAMAICDPYRRLTLDPQ